MPAVMLKIGSTTFGVSQASYDNLRRTSEYRWASLGRLGKTPGQQWIGVGEDTITLEGVVFPALSIGGKTVGTGKIDALREAARQGLPLEVVTGTGHALGKWCITSIGEDASVFFDNGAPRRQGWSLDMRFYGDDEIGLDGILLAGGGGNTTA